jgi:hypothetical protein
MNVSIPKLSGTLTLLALGTVGRAAHADFIWIQETATNTNSGQPIVARSIAVSGANVPYIIDGSTGGVFYLGAQESCNGICSSTPIWVRDGTLTASSVGVSRYNEVFAFDNAYGTVSIDDSGFNFEGSFEAPNGPWATTVLHGCLSSMAQEWDPNIASSDVPLGTGCTQDANGNWGLYSNDVQEPGWEQLPGAGTQIAVFHDGTTNGGSVWAINAEGSVFTYDDDGPNFFSGTWAQTLGASVTAITDHYLVGGNQTIWFWNDDAPNGTGGQVVSGNWQGPVLDGLPNGVPIAQLAYASASSGLVGPSSLWAMDQNGNVFYAFDAVVPR